MTKQELYNMAKALGIPGRSKMDKAQLIEAIEMAQAPQAPLARRIAPVAQGVPWRTTANACHEPTVDGKVVTIATMLAVVNTDQGVAVLDRFSQPGRMAAFLADSPVLSSLGEMPDCDDCGPMLCDELVEAGELIEEGIGFSMVESHFRHNSEAHLAQIIASGQVPPDWAGELSTIGAKGENRHSNVRTMIADALLDTLDNDVLVDTGVSASKFAKHLRELERAGKWRKDANGNWLKPEAINPNKAMAAAWRAALAETDDLDDDIIVVTRHPMTDTSEDIELVSRGDLDWEDYRSWTSQDEATSWEVARTALADLRNEVRSRQRAKFKGIVEWVRRVDAAKVAAAFRWPNGSYHAQKMGKDDQGFALLTSDQRVILDALAAEVTGRKVGAAQAELYSDACYNSQWEAWVAFGKGEPPTDDTDYAEAVETPWDEAGPTLAEASVAPAPKATVIRRTKGQAARVRAKDTALAILANDQEWDDFHYLLGLSTDSDSE